MKQRYRLFRRNHVWYCQDNQTGRQESLHTRKQPEAQRILHAKNEARQQPMINWQIARAYVSASDPAALTRTWQFVRDEMGKCTQSVTEAPWTRGVAEKPFDLLRAKAPSGTR